MKRSCGSNKAAFATGGAFQPGIAPGTIITRFGGIETFSNATTL